jgi:hypothetical protein
VFGRVTAIPGLLLWMLLAPGVPFAPCCEPPFAPCCKPPFAPCCGQVSEYLVSDR